ncbi:hypothetical protein [Corynebacterium timonense]|uniref:DivIVA domain-containing protein n=1 Tax=Corynebacterium timonense TaxID=441500 RepID=A0A1H1QF09_9CORY|nr:hypothetical protein [Corynebacterium timonense]SDS21883.1 hypothetical protein SAMN04488539_1244 [Corynebacterium timonense]
MLSWILLIVVIALVAALGFALSAQIFGRGEALEPMPPGPEVIERNRRAVEDGRLGDVAFEVVHRGYDMQQVDALIAQLTGQPVSPAGVGRAPQPEAAPGGKSVEYHETETSPAGAEPALARGNMQEGQYGSDETEDRQRADGSGRGEQEDRHADSL